jgi:hypothetical protein
LPNDTVAQRARPESRPVQITPPHKGIEIRRWEHASSNDAIDELSKAQEGLSAARDPASLLGNKAITGRIEQSEELSRAQAAGLYIWRSEFNQIQSRYQRVKEFNPWVMPVSRFDYENLREKNFREHSPSGLETLILKEAGNRGYVLFSGGWEKEGSLAMRSESRLSQSSYSYIDAKDVGRATLYVPYFAGFDVPINAKTPVTKATAPLVAIDEDLFLNEKNGVVHHNEFLLDPRADVRSYYSSAKSIQLKPLESRQLEFEPGQAEPATLAKLLGCCVYVRPPAYSAKFVEFLKTLTFDVNHLRIALMVHDSATRSYLAGDTFLSGTGRAEAINRATKDIEPWIVSQLKKASGRTLLLLSHVEGTDYVVRDSSGVETGRIAIQRTNELALHHRVTLFNLGCKTAATLREHDGIGVYDAFNSIHMLRTISKALSSGPKNFASFLERLGTPEARIVIPASIMGSAESVAALKELRDQVGRGVVDGNRLRIPAIDPIVSPSGTTKGFPTSMSVFLTSARPNKRGFFPVIAELHIVMPACKVLAVAKKLKSVGSDHLTCAQFEREPFNPITTHLYGYPKRKFR